MLYIYASNRDFNRAFHRKIVERFDLSLGRRTVLNYTGIIWKSMQDLVVSRGWFLQHKISMFVILLAKNEKRLILANKNTSDLKM